MGVRAGSALVGAEHRLGVGDADAVATAELLRYYLTRHTATVDEYLRKKGLRRQ